MKRIWQNQRKLMILTVILIISLIALNYSATQVRADDVVDDDSFSVSPENYVYSLNPGQAIPSSTFTYAVTSAGSKHVTFPVTATVTLSGSWADTTSPTLDKSSISISGYDSSDSATVTGTVPCSQPAGVVQFTIDAISSATNLNPNSKQTHVAITVGSPPDASCAPSDTTPPVISPTVSGTLGSNGWYTSDVIVSWSVTDPESSFTSTGCETTTIASDTTSTTLTCSATSAGGTSSQSVTVYRDGTPPTVTLTPSRDPDSDGWYNHAVDWIVGGSDATSDSVTCDSTITYSGPDSPSASVTGHCTDAAGNTGSSSVTFKYDSTPPTVTSTVSGTAGTNDWYTSDVSVAWTVTETVSTPVTSTGCDATSITTDTTGDTLTCSSTNAAGLSNSASVTIKRDATPPTVTASPDRAADYDGWYNHPLTVTFSATDATSDVATCDPPINYGSPDTTATSVSGSCSDYAGNSASATFNFKYDATAPTVTITAPSGGGTYTLNAAVPSNYACADATSGLATCTGNVANGANFDTSSVGTKSFTVTATDNAGIPNSVTNSYTVQYASGGLCLGDAGHQILQPINSDGKSVFKQGSTVPAKFRVCDANGNSIGTPGVVKSFELTAIKTGTNTNPVVDGTVVSTTPDTAFRWDPTSQQWIFNINTKSLQAGSTYYYTITLNDGTTITFQFGLK